MEWLPDLAQAVPHQRQETPGDEARPIRLNAHLGGQRQVACGRPPGSHHIDLSPGPKGSIPAQRQRTAPRAAKGSPIAVGADLHGLGLVWSRSKAQLPTGVFTPGPKGAVASEGDGVVGRGGDTDPVAV